MAPLAAPRLPPGRMYFLVQQPIQTSPEDLEVGGWNGMCGGGRGDWSGLVAEGPGWPVLPALACLACPACPAQHHAAPPCPFPTSAPPCLPCTAPYRCRTARPATSCTAPPSARWRAALLTCWSSGSGTPMESSCPAACMRQPTEAARHPHSRLTARRQGQGQGQGKLHPLLAGRLCARSQRARTLCSEPRVID